VVWEFIFLMVILKIPVLYLCAVVWWAIRAEPRPPEGAALPARLDLPEDRPWSPRPSRPTRRGPHGSPVRSYGQRRPSPRPHTQRAG
jgi:hypothetical protein